MVNRLYSVDKLVVLACKRSCSHGNLKHQHSKLPSGLFAVINHHWLVANCQETRRGAKSKYKKDVCFSGKRLCASFYLTSKDGWCSSSENLFNWITGIVFLHSEWTLRLKQNIWTWSVLAQCACNGTRYRCCWLSALMHKHNDSAKSSCPSF